MLIRLFSINIFNTFNSWLELYEGLRFHLLWLSPHLNVSLIICHVWKGWRGYCSFNSMASALSRVQLLRNNIRLFLIVFRSSWNLSSWMLYSMISLLHFLWNMQPSIKTSSITVLRPIFSVDLTFFGLLTNLRVLNRLILKHVCLPIIILCRHGSFSCPFWGDVRNVSNILKLAHCQ